MNLPQEASSLSTPPLQHPYQLYSHNFHKREFLMVLHYLNMSSLLVKNASLLVWISPFMTGLIESCERVYKTSVRIKQSGI
jgi:hypothetical protein